MLVRVLQGPGETRRVTIVAEPRILADYDTALPGWRVAGGSYVVRIARDAADEGLTARARLSPTTMKP